MEMAGAVGADLLLLVLRVGLDFALVAGFALFELLAVALGAFSLGAFFFAAEVAVVDWAGAVLGSDSWDDFPSFLGEAEGEESGSATTILAMDFSSLFFFGMVLKSMTGIANRQNVSAFGKHKRRFPRFICLSLCPSADSPAPGEGPSSFNASGSMSCPIL
jgi:hypothetical protein